MIRWVFCIVCFFCYVSGSGTALADNHTNFNLQDFFQRSQKFAAMDGVDGPPPEEFRAGERIISAYDRDEVNWLNSEYFRRNGFDRGVPVTLAGQVEMVGNRPNSALFAIAGAFWSVSPQSLLPSNYFLVETDAYSYQLSDLGGRISASFAPPGFSDPSINPFLMTVEPTGASARYSSQSYDPPTRAKVYTETGTREANDNEQDLNAASMRSCSAAVTELRRPRKNRSGTTWNYIDDFRSGCLNMDAAGNLSAMNRNELLHLGQCWDAYVSFDQYCYDGWPRPETLEDISSLSGVLFIAGEKGITFRCSATILTEGTIATAAHCLDGWINGEIDIDGDRWFLYFAGGDGLSMLPYALWDILETPSLLEDIFPRVVDVQFSEYADWQNAANGVPPELEPVILTLSHEVSGTGKWIEEVVVPERHQPLVASSLSLFALRIAQLKARLEEKRQPIHADFLVQNGWQRLIRTDNSPICIAGEVSTNSPPTIGHDCQTNRGSSGSLLFLRRDDRLSVLGMHVGAPGRLADNSEDLAPNNLGTSFSETATDAIQ